MFPKKKWFPIALILYLIQIFFELIALIGVRLTNMIPDNMVVVIVLIFALMLIITGMLLFKGMWKKPSSLRRVRRIVSIALALVMTAGSILITHMASRLSRTMDSITADETDDKQISAYIGVYVMSSNNASQIDDLKAETFGIMDNFDQTNTQYAVNYINQQTGANISTTGYPSMVELAQALYDDSSHVIILNEAYSGALTGFDQFVNFDTETKEILRIPVYVENDSRNDLVSGSASSEEKMKAIDAAASKSDITSSPFIIYLSGSDTRDEMLVTSRSDVNLLMVINPTSKQILLLNTPRDYYVENPAGDYAYDKLTHCGIYGIENSEKALENLYNLNVDYYMQINFTGFENLVDAIGGITVNSPVAFSANDIDGGGYDFTEGENDLNGKEALMFARERHAFATGDNARGENQMRVITAVIDKITSDGATVLLNYDKIMDSIEGMFMTDLSDSDLAAIVKMQLTDNAKWNVKSYAVTGSDGSEYTYSAPSSLAYVMYQDADKVSTATALVNKVLNGDTLTDKDLETIVSADSSSSSSSDEDTYSSTDTSSDNSYSGNSGSGYSSTTYDNTYYDNSGNYDTGGDYNTADDTYSGTSGYDSSGDTSTYDSNSGYDTSAADNSGNYSTGDNSYYDTSGYDSSGDTSGYGDDQGAGSY